MILSSIHTILLNSILLNGIIILLAKRKWSENRV
jgi:hypothetical protein